VWISSDGRIPLFIGGTLGLCGIRITVLPGLNQSPSPQLQEDA
jgi:hypothetical protein